MGNDRLIYIVEFAAMSERIVGLMVGERGGGVWRYGYMAGMMVDAAAG